jgi:hypothetical protein
MYIHILGTFQPSRGSLPIWDIDMNIPTIDRGKNDKKSENNEFNDNCNEINGDIFHTNYKNHTFTEFNKIHINNDDKKDIYNNKYNQNKIINNNLEKLYYFPQKNLNFITDEYQDIETSVTDTSMSENLIVLDMVAYTPYPSQSNKTSNSTHRNMASKITSKNMNKIRPENSIDIQFKSPSKFLSEISNSNLFNFNTSFIPTPLKSTPVTPAPLIPTPVTSSSSCISKLKSFSEKNNSQINKNNYISKYNRSYNENNIEITDLKDNGNSELDISPHIMSTNINSNDFNKINISTTDKIHNFFSSEKINNFFSSLFIPITPLSNPNFVRKIDLDLLNHDDLSEDISLYENIMNIKDDSDIVNTGTDVVLGEFERTDYDVKAVSTCPIQ